MTLNDACSAFEGLFAEVKVDGLYAGATVIICTGALGLAGHPPPVICANRDLAIALWARCARDHALDWLDENKIAGYQGERYEDLKRAVLTWITEPQLLQFNMTIQDQMGGQRVATKRFAVYSLCAISEKPQDVVPPAPEETAQCLKPGGSSQTPTETKRAARKAPKARSSSASNS